MYIQLHNVVSGNFQGTCCDVLHFELLCVLSVRAHTGECSDVLEHIHLLWQVETEQTAEAAKIGFLSEVQPHDLV